MLEGSQAIPSETAIHESMRPAGYPKKHTPRLYPRHKQDQPVPLLPRGPSPRPSSDSKPLSLQARPQYGA
jgi:hypothetical protein